MSSPRSIDSSTQILAISVEELTINLPTQQPLGSKKPALVAYVQCLDLAVALTLALWQHPVSASTWLQLYSE